LAETRPNRTLGGAHDEFWRQTETGHLSLQACAAHGHLNWPPVEQCEECEDTNLAWKPVSGRGKVVSWCSFERDYYKGVLPIPWDAIVVELDEGPLFMSNPKGFKFVDVTFGMPVKVAFLDCEDEAGEFRLPVFERA
jgi:uncharacterized OB-fold protein